MRVQKKEDVTVPDDVAAVPRAVPMPVPAVVAVPKTAVPKVVPVAEARPFEACRVLEGRRFPRDVGLAGCRSLA